jgi:sialate O-acetylesterase
MLRPLALLLFFLAPGHFACAALIPNGLFVDGAVLQQGRAIPVWGVAGEGERVTVRLDGHEVSTVARGGKWSVKLPPMKAGGPFTLTMTGENQVTAKDVWVGEVWICGGQSNMERVLGPQPPQKPIDGWQEEVAKADYPRLRQFHVPRAIPSAGEPVDLRSRWVACSPQTAATFSAVGYAFGRDLHRKLGVAVGLIACNWGGTPAEAWMSRETLAADPELCGLLTRLKPVPVQGTPNPTMPCILHESMLAPLQPYAIRGVVWYQGEANCRNAEQYRRLFPILIDDWRKAWGQGDFPFLFVQLAPYRDNTPELREAQLMTSRGVPATAMVVTTDLGDAEDIHPTRKLPVGERLALAARAVAYGESLVYAGPVFTGATFADGYATLRFEHVGSGLVAKGGPLRGFQLAGADGNFAEANAEIQGNTVVVRSAAVSRPVAVRYGWANVPDVNLYNREGLPASPFRSDLR